MDITQNIEFYSIGRFVEKIGLLFALEEDQAKEKVIMFLPTSEVWEW